MHLDNLIARAPVLDTIEENEGEALRYKKMEAHYMSTEQIYKSCDGMYWVEKLADGLYKFRLGHVIFTQFYPSDAHAVAVVKKNARRRR